MSEKPFDCGLQGDQREHWPGLPFDTQDGLMRDRSGRVSDRRPLVGLLYDLLRDHVPAGVLEKLVREQIDKQFDFSNGWMAQYAQDLASRLLGVDEIENGFIEACRPLKRVPTYDSWKHVKDVHIHLRISMTRLADMVVFTANGECRKTSTDAPFVLSEIVLEKVEQELFACGDLGLFFQSYVVEQAFTLAEAQWIAREQVD